MFNVFKYSKLSDDYKYELNNSKEGLNRLIQLTAQLEKEEDERAKYIKLLNMAANNLGLNVWIKNETGAFIYINEPAAKSILRSDANTVLHMKDDDFANDILAQVCMLTDKITIDKNKPCRFLEHARYPTGDLWLDVMKDTLYIKDKFIGVQGVARNITDLVPKEIRDKFAKPAAVEINLDLDYYMDVESEKRRSNLIEILENHNVNNNT